MVSPERVSRVLEELAGRGQACLAGSRSPGDPPLILYIPEVEEIRISPVISRKGYLNILEHKTNAWKKRWVVSTALNYSLFGVIIENDYLNKIISTLRKQT